MFVGFQCIDPNLFWYKPLPESFVHVIPEYISTLSNSLRFQSHGRSATESDRQRHYRLGGKSTNFYSRVKLHQNFPSIWIHKHSAQINIHEVMRGTKPVVCSIQVYWATWQVARTPTWESYLLRDWLQSSWKEFIGSTYKNRSARHGHDYE